jgi:hypothetical protein
MIPAESHGRYQVWLTATQCTADRTNSRLRDFL